MNKVIIIQGLPASGKTFYAKELVTSQGYKRINKDDIRSMLDCNEWNRENEKLVVEVRDAILDLSLNSGFNVVVDDTNFATKHINRIKEIAKLHNADIEIKKMDTSLKECLKRDMHRERGVGQKVIMSMYNKYIRIPLKTQ